MSCLIEVLILTNKDNLFCIRVVRKIMTMNRVNLYGSLSLFLFVWVCARERSLMMAVLFYFIYYFFASFLFASSRFFLSHILALSQSIYTAMCVLFCLLCSVYLLLYSSLQHSLLLLLLFPWLAMAKTYTHFDFFCLPFFFPKKNEK